MLQVVNVSLAFGGRSLFKNVNLKFTKGNCYGVIGANGAGKSTFLKILSKELEPNSGEVLMDKNERMIVKAAQTILDATYDQLEIIAERGTEEFDALPDEEILTPKGEEMRDTVSAILDTLSYLRDAIDRLKVIE